MKSLLLSFFFLGFLGQMWVAAFSIKGSAPQISIKNDDIQPEFRNIIEVQLNGMLKASFDTILNEANQNLSGFKNQSKLAKGLANANAYSVHSASFAGYQNYKWFALGAGYMTGIQAPSIKPGYYSSFEDDVNQKGNLYAGAGFGFSMFNLGIHARFIKPGLYFNLKFSQFDNKWNETNYKLSLIGMGANYRFFKPAGFFGLVKWRGLSLGTGVYMQSSKFSLDIEGESVKTELEFRENIIAEGENDTQKEILGQGADILGFTESHPNASMSLTPSFALDLDVSTTTVPIDATTGFSVLFGVLNVNAGAGFDFNFGKADIEIVGKSNVKTKADNPESALTFSDAELVFEGRSENSPSLTRLRLNGGMGLGLGPVKFDIQAAYFPPSGFALGMSGIVTW